MVRDTAESHRRGPIASSAAGNERLAVTRGSSAVAPAAHPVPGPSPSAPLSVTGSGLSAIGMRREPAADGLPVDGVVAARTAWMWAGCGCWRGAGCGCWRRAGSGRLSRAGSAVTLDAPAGSPVLMGSIFSGQRISLEKLPVDGGAGAGPPGAARRMTQQSPQHQGYRVRPQLPRGRRRGGAARGRGAGARRGGAARGRGAGARRGGAARGRGAGARRGGAARGAGPATSASPWPTVDASWYACPRLCVECALIAQS